MYCHLYVGTQSIKTLSARGKALVIGALTVFLAVSFVISSSFSFSYIANNAYSSSWNDDSEVMIQRYLIQSASNLSYENDRIIESISECINDHNDSLSQTIDTYVDKQESSLTELTTAFVLAKYSRPQDNSDHGFLLSNDVINSWKMRYPNHSADIDGLIMQFDACQTDLNEYYDVLEQIVNDFNIKEDVSQRKWDNILSTLEKSSIDLESLSKSLSLLNDRTNNLRTYIVNVDFDTYRGALSEEISKFNNHVNKCKMEIDNLMPRVKGVSNKNLSSDSDTSLYEQLKELQNNIHTINNANGDDGYKTQIDTILKSLSNIISNYSNNDIFDAKALSNLLELETLVKTYGNCLDLDKQLKDYINSDLSITYKISDDEETNIAEYGNIKNVTYSEWVSARDRDFMKLFSLIRELPSVLPVQENITSNDTTNDNKTKTNNTVNDDIAYNAEAILYEANLLRRDLIGELTDFEKSFNYFKYDFSFMAFFSAFMAVFFDIGAFLTGCFLYVIKHIEKRYPSEEHKED